MKDQSPFMNKDIHKAIITRTIKKQIPKRTHPDE